MLPGALPVVVPSDVFGFVPVAAPEPVVPEGVPTVEGPGAPVPLEPAAPPVWANAMVLESASTPPNANVVIFMVVSWVSLLDLANGGAVFGSESPLASLVPKNRNRIARRGFLSKEVPA